MEFLKEYLDYFIIGLLGFMSFLVMLYTVERLYFYSKVKFEDYDSADELEIALTKNLTLMYIIYSNAPYIGLLGTVIGIIITFYEMGLAGGVDASAVMVGMSLALKATAMGLIVAIPTLMIYNAFGRKVDVILTRYNNR
ncbi:TonB-system energizer ExbB [Campylobacter sputorum subsp. bubulus]|uniref:TonB-system energizer ExbB n=1 Tax=Campylobacter sputorum subsp. sputorum TaxID=32024 RepID=A0A381DIS5_9BACT|nr:TonB-system energizer ExbB [Campylobacter sputorum]ASM35414.1 TonB system transport protein ExbB [Campylobacter sputorum aubsp. sputorum RM3237]ASM38781.1 TonB system transport protein ExbB [Campylobacter sputorum bv. paraureolyticus LMG 11764]KAB0582842.1 TonB-system energizer ExbB [Campylobacter sputorum subsp. sputorum]MDY6120567.1 TonB-system energizer ExbB [Campylobacter sputorum]QEL05606.1 TonB system transport protein ExbB [Campylobacter sputorum subsp. sputorum]